jgi:hypothetical protein
MNNIFIDNFLIKVVVLAASMFILCTVNEPRKTENIEDKVKAINEVRYGDSIVLYWDEPDYNRDSIDFYEIFYIDSNDTEWKLLKTNIVPVQNPKVTIYRTDLVSSDSVFYFSVQYKTKSGRKSTVHYSSDSNASPPGGWRLIWRTN